jgi:hypothetical protein
MIETIQDGETGLKVREKLNNIITTINTQEEYTDEKAVSAVSAVVDDLPLVTDLVAYYILSKS